MSLRRYVYLALLLMAVTPASASAQSASQLYQDGVLRYRNLEFDAAVAQLELALDPRQSPQLTSAQRVDALSYLAAALVFMEQADSAASVFANLIAFDPRYEPDELLFPPEVTSVFDAVRRASRAIAVEAPERTEYQLDEGWFSARLYVSTEQNVLAEIRPEDESYRQTLYSGTVRDSLSIRWNGRDAAGEVSQAGVYYLEISSRDEQGIPFHTVMMPLEVSVIRPDTLALPPTPPESAFRPEQTASSGASAEALAGGVLTGAVVVLVPLAIAPRIDLSSARYVVAGALAAVGLAGSLAYRPGKPLPDNIEYNESLRRELRAQTDSIVNQNAALRREVRFVVVASAPTSRDR